MVDAVAFSHLPRFYHQPLSYSFPDPIVCEDFGKGLRSLYDFSKGDVLAICAANNIDYLIIALGALWSGATVTTANPGYTVPELTYQLKDCGAKVVVTQWSVRDNVREACINVRIDQSCIVLLGDDRDSQGV